MAIKKILVTGSEGYIGTVLNEKLTQEGYFTIGIDTAFYHHLAWQSRTVPFFKKDIRLITQRELEGYDAIIHLAALSNDSLGEIKSELTDEINHKATLNLAWNAKKAGVKRFIFSSSCSVYGIAKNGLVSEKSKPKPLTTYARSKIKSEQGLKRLADKKFTVVLMRNSTVYGFSPAFRDDLVLNNLVASGLTLGKLHIKSDGMPWRPLIDIRDLAEIFIKFLEIPSRKINGEIVNVGFNENNYQITTLAKLVNNKLRNCNISFSNQHEKDSRSYKVNFDKFKKIFPSVKQKWDVDKSTAYLINKLNEYNYSEKHFIRGDFARITQLKTLLKNDMLTDKLFWK